MNEEQKWELLKNNLRLLKKVAIAFSGGVDSTFLLKVAHDVLGNNVIAITAKSPTYPQREFKEAVAFTKGLNIKQIIAVSDELEIEGFSDNPPNRCYLCKRHMFEKIHQIARENGINHVGDGSNFDDLSDYRPGLQAIKELGILSPLKEAKMTKGDIRILSKKINLPTWNKPAFACLSSRFPYGQKITREKLEMVDKAEQYMMDMGFAQVRIRHHGDVARIEVSPDERGKFVDINLMDKVNYKLKELGFQYICLDLKGYRSGSMNETLTEM